MDYVVRLYIYLLNFAYVTTCIARVEMGGELQVFQYRIVVWKIYIYKYPVASDDKTIIVVCF
jgi:hypothetical protein